MATNKNAPTVAPLEMRLDKFLKVSRIIKRRSVANDACDSSFVTVNGKPGKPGTKLKVGDIIAVKFGEKETRYEVTAINASTTKQGAAEMYRLLP